MKKLILSATFSLFYLISFAQSQNDYSYSIGFRLLSYGEYPKLLNEIRSTDKYVASPLNGIIFKFNDNQISYRVIVSTSSKKDYSFVNECKDCEVVKGEYDNLTLKLGFEKSLIYGTVQPFYGLDLGYKKTTFDGEAFDKGATTAKYNATVEKNNALLYPFVGLRVNLLKSILTLSAEAGVNILYSYDKETKFFYATQSTTVNNFKRFGFYNQPLGMLALQFNFNAQ